MKSSLDQIQNYEFRSRLDPNPWNEVAQLIHDVGGVIAFPSLSGLHPPAHKPSASVLLLRLSLAGDAASLYKEFYWRAREAQRTDVLCLTPAQNKTSIAFHRALGFDLVESPHLEGETPIHRNDNGRDDDHVLFRRSMTDVSDPVLADNGKS